MSLNDQNEYALAKEELERTKAQMDVPLYMFNIFLCITIVIIALSIYYFFIRDRFICNALAGGGVPARNGFNPQISQSIIHLNTSQSVRTVRESLTTQADTDQSAPDEQQQQQQMTQTTIDL